MEEAEELQTPIAVLDWMSERGDLSLLQQRCELYHQQENGRAVYRFVLEVDVCQLLQFNASLGNLLLHKPRHAWEAFQHVCFTAITTEGWLPSLTTPSQLLLLLRLTSLPDLPGYVVEHISDFPPVNTEPRFLSLAGVVCGASLREKYTQSTCFYCPAAGCLDGKDSRYIRLHIAGATEANTVRGGFQCHHCGETVVEDVAHRSLADKMVAHVVPAEALRMVKSSPNSSSQHRYQAIPIVLRGELCEGVRMGGQYTVIGVPVYELSASATQAHISIAMEVNNVLPVNTVTRLQDYTLPSSIRELYQACQYSPWALASSLAYSFAAEVCPPGTYHRLKLAMLLSLVTCASSSPSQDRSCLDLLAIGSDTPLLLRLLMHGTSLAPRSILHSGSSSLYGSVRKEGGHIFVDAGSLLLAEGGVCLVGSLGQLRKEQREKLQHTMETGQISVSVPGRVAGDEAQRLSWPLRCSVWATSHPHHRSRGHTVPLRDQTMNKMSNISKALADHMGLVVDVDCPNQGTEELVTKLLTQHTLHQATGCTPQTLLCLDDLRQYLGLVGGATVAISPAASHLLQVFYQASRRVRTSSIYSTDVPVTAKDTMCSLTIGHARLSHRTEATVEDAVMAILLYEESLTSRFGYSVLQICPAPHFRDDNIGAYIGREYDQSMRALHAQILQFCKSHTLWEGLVPPMPEE